MNLAEVMGWFFVVLITAIVVGCVLLLNVSIESVLPAAVDLGATPKSVEVVSAGVVKIVTSSLLFILSYGLLRFAVGYFRFSAKAESVKEKAESLLASGNSDQIQAIKLWQDYHLARAAAPLIPNWTWRLREKKLNALWRDYMCEAGETPASVAEK